MSLYVDSSDSALDLSDFKTAYGRLNDVHQDLLLRQPHDYEMLYAALDFLLEETKNMSIKVDWLLKNAGEQPL